MSKESGIKEPNNDDMIRHIVVFEYEKGYMMLAVIDTYRNSPFVDVNFFSNNNCNKGTIVEIKANFELVVSEGNGKTQTLRIKNKRKPTRDELLSFILEWGEFDESTFYDDEPIGEMPKKSKKKE